MTSALPVNPAYPANVLIADPRTAEAYYEDNSSFTVWADRDRYDMLASGDNPRIDGKGLTYGQQFSRRRRHVYSTYRTTKVEDGGAPACSFIDRFYGRFHIIPSQVNVGNLVTAQAVNIAVWNAWEEPRELQSIDPIDADGIELDFVDSALPPLLFKEHEVRQMLLKVGLTGEPEIDARYDFYFEQSEIRDLEITGRRTVLFPVPPDMGQAYVEKLKWTTDIITAESGKEQRISLRDAPEMAIEASYTAFFEGYNLLDALLWGWQSRVFGLPLWHFPIKLTAKANAGDKTIQVSNPAFKRFNVGTIGVIHCNSRHFEPFTIEAVGPTSIDLVTPLEKDWPAGTTVMPVRTARTEKEINAQLPVSRIGTMPMRFILEEDEYYPAIENGQLYKDHYIFEMKPNWIEPLQESSKRNLDIENNDVGERVYVDHSGLSSVTRSFLMYFKDLSAVDQFKSWYYARRGAQVPFWVPSWKNDFPLVEGIQQGSSILRIKNIGMSAMYERRSGRDHLYIVTRTCDLNYPREITDITVDPSDESFELVFVDQPFPTDHPLSQIDIACFMGLHRMASDTMEIEWITDQVVQINSNMKMLSDGV